MSTEFFQLENNGLAYHSDTSEMRIGIVVTEWNAKITESLLSSTVKTLIEFGVKECNITIMRVPGSFELVYGCAKLSKDGFIDAIIALGCVIKGDTPHFDYICQGTTQGLATLNCEAKLPVINGVLTTLNQEQAIERSTGEKNKGREFAITALKMIDYSWELTK